MRIVCPSCSAAFEVPKTRLAPGQAVRCARCGTDWTPLAAPEPAKVAQSGVAQSGVAQSGVAQSGVAQSTVAQSEVAQSEQSPERPLPSRNPEPVILTKSAVLAVPRRTLLAPLLNRLNLTLMAEPALVAGWTVSIAVLLALVWAAVIWRSDVMHAWPPSERLYTTLGLAAER